MVKEYRDYLVDGVYVCFDGYQIWLYLNEGDRGIAIEPNVFEALCKCVERLKEELSKEPEED